MKSKNLSENILKVIKSNGYKYIDLDTVIDTNLILERSGENFKRFIFSFNEKRKKNANIIKQFLKIKCPLEKAANKLNHFFKKIELI